MGRLWARNARRWRRTAARVSDVPALRCVIATLEQHIRAGVQRQEFMTQRRAAWRRQLLEGSAAAESLHALVAELRDSVVIMARSIGGEGNAEQAEVHQALLRAWREQVNGEREAHRFGISISGWNAHNSLKLTYKQLYALLLSVSKHAEGFTRGDEGTHGVAAGVNVPSMVVATVVDDTLSEHISAAQVEGPVTRTIPPPEVVFPATSTTQAPTSETIVQIDGLTWPLEDRRFLQLRDELHEALTNFERLELVDAFVQRHRPNSESAPSLTCPQLRSITETFTLSTRRKAVLISLHPYLTDKLNFPSLVDDVLMILFDREDVKREVAATQRRAWLEDVHG